MNMKDECTNVIQQNIIHNNIYEYCRQYTRHLELIINRRSSERKETFECDTEWVYKLLIEIGELITKASQFSISVEVESFNRLVVWVAFTNTFNNSAFNYIVSHSVSSSVSIAFSISFNLMLSITYNTVFSITFIIEFTSL